MARVLLIKPFTGLHLAVSQLSAELRRAGHETRIVYFKRYLAVPTKRESEYRTTPYPGRGTFIRGEEWNWTCFRPPIEREYELLVEEIQSFGADLVGFSLQSGSMPLAAEMTARIRQSLDVPIIWGGVGPTIEPEQAIQHADLVCVGEGEEAIVELANRIQEGRQTDDVQGIWAKRNGEIVRNGKTKTPDLERIATPDFEPSHHVFIDGDLKQTDFYPHGDYNQYIIMTQRGCPFSCSFCVESRYQTMFGKKGSVRRRSVDLVIDELVRARERLDFRSVMFYDDVFTIHRKWLVEFAEKYSKHVGLPFWCYTYPTTTRVEDIRMLREAGLASMTMGIQTGSQRILNDYFNRPAPLEEAAKAAQVILSHGIKLYFDMISKVPWETEDDLRSTFNFLTRLPHGVVLVGVGYMVSYPTYGYTEKMVTEQPKSNLTDRDYDYYHRLYVIAVSNLPTSAKRAIALNPIYRKKPELLDPFMPRQIDFHYLVNDDQRSARRRAQRTLDLGFAQSELADDLPSVTRPEPNARQGAARHLPLLST